MVYEIREKVTIDSKPLIRGEISEIVDYFIRLHVTPESSVSSVSFPSLVSVFAIYGSDLMVPASD